MDGLTASEQAVLQFISRAGPDGALVSQLRTAFDSRTVTEALRSLMGGQKVAVERATAPGDHIVTLKRAPVTENFGIILSVIRAAGSSGIDAAAIGSRTKITKVEVNKALNSFEQQGQIKSTRCFTNKAKKLYILAGLEPSIDVTGGTFYTEARELDSQFIGHVRAKLVAAVTARDMLSVAQMKQWLDQDGAAGQRRLTVNEVATVARTLELDGAFTRVTVAAYNRPIAMASDSAAGDRKYKLSKRRVSLMEPGLVTDYPCLSCPLLGTSCLSTGRGVATPAQCAYLDDWLATPQAAAVQSPITPTSPSDMPPPKAVKREPVP